VQIPKRKKDSQVVSLFALSESGRAKTTGRMLMFMFMQAFYAIPKHQNSVKPTVSFCTLGSVCVKASAVHKLLMKLTPGRHKQQGCQVGKIKKAKVGHKQFKK